KRKEKSMQQNDNEPGPGFEYFLNTHCQDWDAIQYHEAWKIISRSHSVATHGTTSSHGYGLRLRYYSYPWNHVFAWLRTTSPLLATATHGTTSLHGYGLRLRCSQLLESRKMGRIDNFWSRSLPVLKSNNPRENEKLNAENIFLSCNLSCDGVQFAGTGNIIQVHKQPYKIHEQSGVKEPPSRLRKRNHSINYVESSSGEETDSDYEEKSKRMKNESSSSFPKLPDDDENDESESEAITRKLKRLKKRLESQSRNEREINVSKKFKEFQIQLIENVINGRVKITWNDKYETL
ncbi:7727_t:CDS:2, partial [Dentiscutata erythropus]